MIEKDRVIWWTNWENWTITCRRWYIAQKIITDVTKDIANLWWTGSRLKVSWLVWTNSNWLWITANQAWNVKILNWNFDKSKLKSIIISETTKLVNSLSQNNTDWVSNPNTNRITDFSDLYSSLNYWWEIVGTNKNIKLFKTNKVVTIWDETYTSTSPIEISWKKTMTIIYWWDLYINRDMYYANNSILWIIVLKDKNWKWWNVLINPGNKCCVNNFCSKISIISWSK